MDYDSNGTQCVECGKYNLVYEGGYFVCIDCGFCNDGLDISYSPVHAHVNPDITYIGYPKDDGSICKISCNRYKTRFHCNERLCQCTCSDPEIPIHAFREIRNEYISGFESDPPKYPCKRELRRFHIFRICKATQWYDSGLKRIRSCRIFCERWKTLHYKLTGITPDIPSQEIVEYIKSMFSYLQFPWSIYCSDLPSSKSKSGTKKPRHNFMNFNYTYRKILESKGIYRFHGDFPTLKTPSKIHDLDNIMEKCAKFNGMKFTRSCVIERPKYKLCKKFKRK